MSQILVAEILAQPGPSVNAEPTLRNDAIRRKLALRILTPEILMGHGGLVFQQRPDNLDLALAAGEDFAARQRQRRIFRMIAGERQQALLG